MHLSFIVDQTEKYSTWLTEGLAATSAAASVEPSPTTTTKSLADADKSERATSVDVDGLYWSHFLYANNMFEFDVVRCRINYFVSCPEPQRNLGLDTVQCTGHDKKWLDFV